MKYRIENLSLKKFIGIKLKMTFENDRTYDLWRTFMPRRKEITNVVSSDLFSLKMFKNSMTFDETSFNEEFDKWAALEVSDFINIPDGMEKFELHEGQYVVFEYKGSSSEGNKVFAYIYGSWIPQSEYLLDNSRAHFEILGEKYKNNSPESEEEIWIPIKHKNT